MPNAIATLGRERTLATLARRVYAVDASDRTLLARVERALLGANPRLRDAGGFRSGASIVVPELPGVAFGEAVQRAEATEKGLLDSATIGLKEFGSRTEDRFAEAEESRARIEERISDDRFVRLAQRALPEAGELIAKTKARIDAERATAEEAQARIQKGIAEALEAVERLRAQGIRDE